MQIDQYIRLNKEDFQEAPEWTTRLFDNINQTLEQLVQALQNRLSFSDNNNAEIRTIQMSEGVEKEILLNKVKGKPVAVFVIYSELYDYIRLAWKYSDVDKVKVKVSWDSSPSSPYDVTFLVVGR